MGIDQETFLDRELILSRERERIAEEMHDGVAQTLYGIALQARLCRQLLHANPQEVEHKLQMLEDHANAGIRDIRCHIFNLREDSMEKRRLPEAVKTYLELFADLTNVRAELHLEGEERPVHRVTQRNLICITREALSNIQKHARASRVWVTIRFMPVELSLTIKDDGVGYVAEAHDFDDPAHMGLSNIERRVDYINGQLTTTSRPGGGTEVVVTCPYEDMVIAGSRL